RIDCRNWVFIVLPVLSIDDREQDYQAKEQCSVSHSVT
ncbi:hypothetical protein LCGC14_2761070, partial [marine sediment metagenome]